MQCALLIIYALAQVDNVNLMLDGRFTPEELVVALREKFGVAPEGLAVDDGTLQDGTVSLLDDCCY